MLDILKLVSSDDIGQDESNVQTLLKKHKVNLTIYLSVLSIFLPLNMSIYLRLYVYLHNFCLSWRDGRAEQLGTSQPSILYLYQSISTYLPIYQDVTDELKNYQPTIEALHEQASALGEEDRESGPVVERLASIDRRYL